ncbi:MAG: molecular chaperone TorD family protein [Rhodovarius sp.]|nr:molecular chaperone TorD family protein [Rhodovarius sp.]
MGISPGVKTGEESAEPAAGVAASAIDRAIEAAGGLEAFRKLLGVSRRTVFHWKQHGVPAERAPEIEAATGIGRHLLRPDLFPPPPGVTEGGPAGEAADPLIAHRAGAFALLGALLAAEPDAALLAKVAALPGDETPLGAATGALAAAARASTPEALEREYFDLFIGVGRGEILPYASYYLTGFLHERPLAELRGTLRALGVVRRAGVAEPEDHIAFLCETMAGLLLGRIPPTQDGFGAAEFYARHIRPWAGRLFADLAANGISAFYRAVGGFGRVVLDIENAAAELPE